MVHDQDFLTTVSISLSFLAIGLFLGWVEHCEKRNERRMYEQRTKRRESERNERMRKIKIDRLIMQRQDGETIDKYVHRIADETYKNMHGVLDKYNHLL